MYLMILQKLRQVLPSRPIQNCSIYRWKLDLFFSLILATHSVLLLLLLLGYCIGRVMSYWPCSKMAWAPYGRDGVEGVSSSSQRVFGSGRLEQDSAAKESSCCPPPLALCYARWRPLDLRTEKAYVNTETQHKITNDKINNALVYFQNTGSLKTELQKTMFLNKNNVSKQHFSVGWIKT